MIKKNLNHKKKLLFLWQLKPGSIFRQELASWEYTDNGFKRTTIIRSFEGDKYIDSYLSEPITLKKSYK